MKTIHRFINLLSLTILIVLLHSCSGDDLQNMNNNKKHKKNLMLYDGQENNFDQIKSDENYKLANIYLVNHDKSTVDNENNYDKIELSNYIKSNKNSNTQNTVFTVKLNEYETKEFYDDSIFNINIITNSKNINESVIKHLKDIKATNIVFHLQAHGAKNGNFCFNSQNSCDYTFNDFYKLLETIEKDLKAVKSVFIVPQFCFHLNFIEPLFAKIK